MPRNFFSKIKAAKEKQGFFVFLALLVPLAVFGLALYAMPRAHAVRQCSISSQSQSADVYAGAPGASISFSYTALPTVTNDLLSGTITFTSDNPNIFSVQGPGGNVQPNANPQNVQAMVNGVQVGSSTLVATLNATEGVGGPPCTSSAYVEIDVIQGTGTITVQSVDANSGANVTSSWSFVGPSGSACSSPCSGTTATYAFQPTSGYSQYALSPGSAPSGYSGYTILLNGNSNSSCSSNGSCAGMLPLNGTLTFTIEWQPEEPILAASWDPTYLVTSTTITVPTGGSLINIPFYVRNIGPAGSQLYVPSQGCYLSLNPSNFTGIFTCTPPSGAISSSAPFQQQ